MIGPIALFPILQQRLGISDFWKPLQFTTDIAYSICEFIGRSLSKLKKALNKIPIQLPFSSFLPLYLSHSNSCLKPSIISLKDLPPPFSISASTSSIRAFSSSIVYG